MSRGHGNTEAEFATCLRAEPPGRDAQQADQHRNVQRVTFARAHGRHRQRRGIPKGRGRLAFAPNHQHGQHHQQGHPPPGRNTGAFVQGSQRRGLVHEGFEHALQGADPAGHQCDGKHQQHKHAATRPFTRTEPAAAGAGPRQHDANTEHQSTDERGEHRHRLCGQLDGPQRLQRKEANRLDGHCHQDGNDEPGVAQLKEFAQTADETELPTLQQKTEQKSNQQTSQWHGHVSLRSSLPGIVGRCRPNRAETAPAVQRPRSRSNDRPKTR